ncbi:hypothetical protein J2X31_000183 [Flavobacterium arsenatis]|uniref:Secretion system C-terminal sorting domain-containing protein n=1 Tax=Flavobacterium arsenatis TaxID=1484332 RepID=A0ABU1TJN2_9FLAO|nr:T9SS type A sorting domain-containing protein [Flavobacterium arsenatis]MDR6966190.1 hypothetical protein [Flavobacterium arsenatis]
MKKNYRLVFSSILLVFALFSANAQGYVNGIFMLNEIGDGQSATVSFLPNGGTLENDIFGTVNPTAGGLGNTGQSMSFHGENAYIILNTSNRLRVVNSTTFALVNTLNTGLSNPRYMAFANGKGYITCWGDVISASDDYVAVLNLETYTIETTIPMAEGVERILEINGKLYVAHKGGYGYGNQISVLDPINNTVETTIQVGDVPNTMVVDNGFLYVLSEGKPSWAGTETFGALSKINLTTNAVVSTLDFPLLHPANLKIANGNFYYSVFEDVFMMSSNATELPAEPLFTLPTAQPYGIYGLDIIDDSIYVVDAGFFSAPSDVYVYDLDGTLLDDFEAGIATNGFYKALEVDLDIKENQKNKLAIYPNPTTEVFYINTNETATIKLFDVSGRLVKTEKYTSSGINVAHLAKGVYLVETEIGNNRNVEKLIVK